MESKILLYEKNVNRYRKLSDEYSEKEEYLSALSFLHSAKSINFSLDVIMDMAYTYSDIGSLELSNKYWFMYLDKAPKERVAVAYEELAINYFYMDNYWASSYYFHQKLAVDGYISKEGLSQEIIDFFSGTEFKKLSYRIAYPLDRADYSYEIKKAKHAMAVGDFSESVKVLSSIPFEYATVENAGDLAISYYMCQMYSEAEEVCRKSLKQHGESVTAYCNLSTVYDMKEDFDNSDFYYHKALDCAKGEKGEEYKLVTCAIERDDHVTASKCLKKIVEDRPYELSMKFFYAISLANQKMYIHAINELKDVLYINPEDTVVKFYLDYIQMLDDGDGDKLNLMPFKYEKELPEKVTKRYIEKIRSLVAVPEKIEKALKTNEIKKAVEWGLFCRDSEIIKNTAYILSVSNSKYTKDLITSSLLNPEGGEEMKRVLVYVWLMKGIKEKIGVVAGSYYLKLKPNKLLAEKDREGLVFVGSYALCVSRIIFYEIDDLDKLAKSCDRIYKKFKGLIGEAEISNEELSALILCEAKLKRFKKDEDVLKIFNIDKNKLNTLKRILKGE